MHYLPKIKILDLDHVKSIIEQEITVAEAEKIVGGGKPSKVFAKNSSSKMVMAPIVVMTPIDILPRSIVIHQPIIATIHIPSGPNVLGS